ncbi:MAG: hypothetical protein Q9162_003973 [Coniocarpon cinnabarinum]
MPALKRSHSLSSQIATSFTTGRASDFTILCHGHSFPVHKYVLRLRSGYFERLFSSPQLYVENQNNQLELNDEDVHPIVLKALLNAVYGDEYKLDVSSLTAMQLAAKAQETQQRNTPHGEAGGENTAEPSQKDADDTANPPARPQPDAWPQHKYLKYHAAVSQLADRFQVPGIDNLIVEHAFTVLNATNSTWKTHSTLGPIRKRLRSDDEFLDAVSTVFLNAGRNESPEAQKALVELLVDHLPVMNKQARFQEWLANTDGLAALVVQEMLRGAKRAKCANCGVIERGDIEDLLRGEDISKGTKAHVLEIFRDEYTKQCENCNSIYPTALWLRLWEQGLGGASGG